MTKVTEEILARLLELQQLMISASLAGNTKRHATLTREYEILMESFSTATYGADKGDPDEVFERVLSGAKFQELPIEPVLCEEFSISDSLYAGEGYFPGKRPLNISAVRYSQPRADRIQFVELETDYRWSEGGLKFLGHFSSDTGCILVLNRRRKTEKEKQDIEQWLISTFAGEMIRPIAAHGFVGLMIESWYGSGGFCVYSREQSLILDFSSVRTDPECLFGNDEE